MQPFYRADSTEQPAYSHESVPEVLPEINPAPSSGLPAADLESPAVTPTNPSQTHCPKGHVFTFTDGNGRKSRPTCSTCEAVYAPKRVFKGDKGGKWLRSVVGK